ncbi:YCF48-related protein [Marinobacter santoriniensis]|nr:YCF48-related protein [Marinobacter santoriniensis]
MVGKTLGFLAQVAPWAVVSGLAYAAAFVKPGVQPLPLPQPLIEPRDRFYDVARSGDGRFWFSGSHGVVLEGTPDSAQWHRFTLPEPVNLQGVAASDDGIIVTAGNEGWVFTGTGGEDWQAQHLPVSDVAGKLVDVIWLDGQFWVIGEMGAVFRSDDDGQNWVDLGMDEDISLNDLARSPDGTLWIAAEFGTLFRSKDGGATWTGTELGAESLRALAFHGDDGVIAANGGVVYRTADGGQSWRRVQTPSREHLYDVAWDGQRWVVTGNGGSLLASDDGAEWTSIAPDGLGSGYYTRLVTTGKGLVLAGQTIGEVVDGQWQPWPPAGARNGEDQP